MSKPLYKRNSDDREMVLITKAHELTAYTCRICTNENNFPKRFRWCITNKIVESAVDIDRYINAANSVNCGENDELDLYRLRLYYQKRALAMTYSLLSSIEVARATFGIPAERLQNWTKQIYTVQNYTRAWIKSDAARFMKK